MANERQQPSPPPRFSADEREAILREVKALSDRVSQLERAVHEHTDVANEVHQLRGAFDSLDEHVRDMMQADTNHVRDIGELKQQAAIWAMHAGGQVGGVTGGAAGTDAARGENKSHTARNAVLTMVLSCVTAIVVALIQSSAQPVKPVPAGVTADQATIDRVDRLERELKREQQPKP